MGNNQNLTLIPDLYAAAAHYEAFMRALCLPITADTAATPERVAKMFCEEFSSHMRPEPEMTMFDAPPRYDQYIVERDIEFFSLCEHHHLPFSGVVHIGYQPHERIVGLSKLHRAVRHFAARPQLQERLVCDIADFLFEHLDPWCLIVIADASHMCVQARGVRDPKSRTVTSKILPDVHAVDKDEMLRLMGVH